METITHLLEIIEGWMWGVPLLLIIFGVGIYLTVILRGIQFRLLFYALKLAFTRHDDRAKGDISQFQALMTALAAMIGIGSITGIATGIAVGGLGCLFWVWVTALICMSTKYAEGVLAIKYRSLDEKKEMCGGPMYYLEKGLKSKGLGMTFAIVGALSAFGTGNIVQANSIADAIDSVSPISPMLTGIVLAVFTAITLFGGIKSIGKVAGVLVPVMSSLYIIGGLIVLVVMYERIPNALYMIVKTAFTGEGAVGGFVGSSWLIALEYGVSRGIFASEAGLGTAPIAAAAAKTDVPARQALISMSGVFLTAFIVCTITGLVIAVTNVLGQTGPDGQILNGSAMAVAAFEKIIPGGGIFVMISILLFGFSTIIGWAFYGEKCIEYLMGIKVVPFYRIIFTLILIPGAFLGLRLVWGLSSIMNGFMAIPNLIGLFALAKVVKKETISFEKLIKKEKKK